MKTKLFFVLTLLVISSNFISKGQNPGTGFATFSMYYPQSVLNVGFNHVINTVVCQIYTDTYCQVLVEDLVDPLSGTVYNVPPFGRFRTRFFNVDPYIGPVGYEYAYRFTKVDPNDYYINFVVDFF